MLKWVVNTLLFFIILGLSQCVFFDFLAWFYGCSTRGQTPRHVCAHTPLTARRPSPYTQPPFSFAAIFKKDPEWTRDFFFCSNSWKRFWTNFVFTIKEVPIKEPTSWSLSTRNLLKIRVLNKCAMFFYIIL